ncbi:hypothetical protein DY000_02022141 [Brassica cretica]|uniref:Piwi domain-containing protein n=1 Tax=Brassica cretica TaxID=69181 RepID=A0ABQ7E2L6_BRACR|nr:hypothetical protein DY000_02022141 [Brassica cretica]
MSEGGSHTGVISDGVGETQFEQVLRLELQAIRQACLSLRDYKPTITFVVVQKRHHTRFFPTQADMTDKTGNVLPGTVVDTVICHPYEFDFYLNSHAGLMGTNRPVHYHVLSDENEFSSDDLQSLTNSLCYTFAKTTRSVSLVTPVYYAHLAAFRARYYIEGEMPALHLPAIKDNIWPLLGFPDLSMAEDTSPVPSPHPFVEVFCEISGKYYRFATGTKAEFAVSVINRKLDSSKSKALYIEAAKEGEEPISFGDGASLVSYGHGWRLKTVIDVSDFPGTEKENTFQRQFPSVLLSTGSKDSKPAKTMKAEVEGDQSLKYIGRIMFAFLLMFILGGLFTVALENLPRLILLFNNPSM